MTTKKQTIYKQLKDGSKGFLYLMWEYKGPKMLVQHLVLSWDLPPYVPVVKVNVLSLINIAIDLPTVLKNFGEMTMLHCVDWADPIILPKKMVTLTSFVKST